MLGFANLIGRQFREKSGKASSALLFPHGKIEKQNRGEHDPKITLPNAEGHGFINTYDDENHGKGKNERIKKFHSAN